MRIIKLTGIACVAATMAGCSWSKQQLHRHDNDYVRGSGQVARMDAPGARAKSMGEYYPVPPNGNVDTPPPSMVPPGSNFKSAQTSADLKSAAKPAESAQLVNLKSGGEALVLASKQAAAWKKVGGALKTSGYQVLDQDSEMGAYFILDASETGNKITNETPILRVNLKPNQNTTQVTLASHDNGRVDTKISDRILHQLQKNLG